MAKSKRVKKKKSGGGIRALLAALMLVAAIGAVAAAWFLLTPYGNFDRQVMLDFPHGSGFRGIADSLTKAGVIRSPYQFYVIRALRPKTALQAGEYQFTKPASAWIVFDRIARGDIHYYEVTIPEGSNLFDIGRILQENTPIRSDEFIQAAKDPSIIRDLDPQAPTLEGYLFPATYRLTKHTTARRFAHDMTDRFRKTWKEVGGRGDAHRIVTLASLVEKETGVPSERPTVASVYTNRLERNMKLECDPTTIYAAMLDGRYRGTIYRSDLDSRNPYNTYQHPGLPPGPIANPGAKSLSAAMHPAETNFIFFVARPDGSGGHVFTTNSGDHSRAVSDYRRGQQKGKAADPSTRVSRPGRSPGA